MLKKYEPANYLMLFLLIFFVSGNSFSSDFESNFKNCTKSEIYGYIKEGLPRKAVEAICSASERLESRKCCCVTVLEDMESVKIYSTKHQINNTRKTSWIVLEENRSILPIDQCWKTERLGYYTRKRSFCKKLDKCW